MRIRQIAAGISVLATFGLAGCALIMPRPVSENPLVVPSADFETVWKASIGVLDEYFDIATENRLGRTIITQPKIGATVLEPWARDSVGLGERVESTLQTIRRHAEVKVDPAPGGGFTVKVMVYKEIEDMVRPDRQASGRAVFNNDFATNRARDIVGPVPASNGWIPQNRDPKLEQVILQRIRDALFL